MHKQWIPDFSSSPATKSLSMNLIIWQFLVTLFPSYSIYLAFFSGSHALECKHWSCAGVQSLAFFITWKAPKVEILIVHGHTRRLRTGKRAKVVGNLQHASSYRGSNISHTLSIEHTVDWTTHKVLPFCFSPILITSCLHREDTSLSLRIHIHVLGEPGNETTIY